MSNFLRRLPLPRLLLLCGVLLAVGIGATALAAALGVGPTPPAKPLANAVHDALAGANAQPIQGVSARVELTNHLLEGASLASGSGGEAGQFAASPLLSGASGRLWIAKDGRVRLELQSEKGDTEILYDGHTVTLYDASSGTLYRYTPKQGGGEWGSGASGSSGSGANGSAGSTGVASTDSHQVPTVAQIQEGIDHISQHATLSGATPTDVAGQPAYTVRVSPSHNGGMLAGAELSFDAAHGVPLRAAIYSTNSSAPVIELAATEISYEAVPDSVFAISPPPGTKVQEVSAPKEGAQPSGGSAGSSGSPPKLTTHGQGLDGIAVLESPVKEGAPGKSSPALPEGLQKVQINGVSAAELPTALGTLLSFERSGVRYLLVGSVAPAAIEAFARGL
jgi:outer membrane lipoprotein-sorting protein